MGPRRMERATETSQERNRGRRALDPVSRCWIIKTKLSYGRRGDYLKSRPAGQLPHLPLRNKLQGRRVHSVWRVTTDDHKVHERPSKVRSAQTSITPCNSGKDETAERCYSPRCLHRITRADRPVALDSLTRLAAPG